MDATSPRKIGKYEITGILGRGGMGVVYLAEDKRIGRQVAIKTLTEGFSGQPENLKRFYREAQAGILQHPNIAIVYDLGDEDGMPFIVMEFLKGEPLDKLISSGPPLPLFDKLTIIEQVCSALGYAHQRGVIHRDIKPANVMVQSNPIHAKIVDFGIARIQGSGEASSLTRTGNVIGTIHYIAPERLKGLPFDGRSDIFSAGVMLYYLLAGQLPFTGEDIMVAQKLVNEPHSPLSLWLNNYPPALDGILDRALAKEPNDRYGTAEEFAADLHALCEEMRIEQVAQLFSDAERLNAEEKFGWAREVLFQLVRIDPQHTAARQLLGTVQQNLARIQRVEQIHMLEAEAQEAIKSASFREAVNALDQAVKLDPGSEDLRARLEDAQEKKRRHDEIDTLLAQADLHRERGEWYSALGAVEKALQFNPEDAGIRSAYATISQQLKRPQTSAGITDLLKLLPQNAVDVTPQSEPASPDKLSTLPLNIPQRTHQDLSTTVHSTHDRLLAGSASIPETLDIPGNIGESWPSSSRSSSNDKTVLIPQLPTELLRLDSEARGGTSEKPTGGPPAKEIGDAPGEFTQIFQRIPATGPSSSEEQLHPRVKLVFNSSKDPLRNGMYVSVSNTPFLIGRSPNASLTISSDDALSMQHCEIDWIGGAYVIRDLRSTNGTWLDGRRLNDRAEILVFGSVIRFSSSTFLTFGLQDVFEFPDLKGCTINGRYKLQKLIRQTGKSAFYQGEDLRLPQSVAIKILSPDLASYPGYIQQFNQEAELAARLHHPHITRAHDFGLTEFKLADGSTFHSQYICLEYMHGGNLADHIGEGNFLKPDKIVNWLEPITDALEYIHGENMVHGGLKTTSVVFDKNSKVYLTDFAFASHSSDTSTISFMGAPDFMAPEQWDGEKPTALTDQYSLAVLTYYSLVGFCPFDGQIDPKTRKRNFARGAAPVHEEAHRQGNTEISESLSPVIQRGLSVKPENRYPSVRDYYLAFVSSLVAEKGIQAQIRIFISYRRDSASAWAMLFANELRRLGIRVSVDTELRDKVVRFPSWLEEEIVHCDVFVCFLSANTLESEWVLKEIRLASVHGKSMIPIFQEDFKHPDSSATLEESIDALLMSQGVKLLDRTNQYIDAAIGQLAKMIEHSVGTYLPKDRG